jgi:hypothetical protein
MKLYTEIPAGLQAHFSRELKGYKQSLLDGDLGKAWSHLERAHILGQAYPWQHSYAHLEMLKFGFRIKSTKEVLGQIPRLLIGGVKSFVGKIPVGNTGGANVHPLQPMEIPQDLKNILHQYERL